ncbi:MULTISPECIES: YggT family protein [Paenibacillus]|uniref:YggT family protein n=1 Tax=Paenibacillus typhae TaxID=1174501 RepID=A0A1G8HRI0_9BACL|nr:MULTISPECIES: YggT family protein [Paenibacillus]MDF9843200.1 YggT family protein [Paenibacillus sp. PastF-2]MDF9849788.1 YggT family protein [Paenibacillus sp. PastM-2]MDF9856495.1 YggT family protein [Paenibacillus sp. PastF-1]MDH6481765.1 YggT family protein [Paenibacillus sp. PastH-2]MDH6509145.1 YggT family protein [Paenibacillus sp. PastM-3]
MNEISSIINILFQIYYYMIIIYILMSWLPNLRENFIGELLGKLVEPYLSPFRRIIPPLFGTLDISPIIALFVLRFAVVGLHSIVAMLFG